MNHNGKLNSSRLKSKAHSSMGVGRTSSIGSNPTMPNKAGAVDKTETKFPDTKFPPRRAGK